MRTNALGRLRVLLLATFVCIGQCEVRAAEICRTLSLAGFEAPAAIAKRFVGKPTSDVKAIKVYITVADGQLYVESNYIVPGYAYPSKLAIDDKKVTLDDIVWNLLAATPSSKSRAEAKKLVRENIEFFVNRFELNRSVFADLDFSAAKKVNWDPDTGQEPIVQSHLASGQSSSPTNPVEPLSSFTEPPKGLYEAAIQLLWPSLFGKLTILIVAAGAALLAAWSALTESGKERLLDGILRRQRSPSTPHKQGGARREKR
jgi:hypothetical protein